MPINKNNLKIYNIDNPPKVQLGRKEEIQKKYDIYNSNIQNRLNFLEKIKNEIQKNNYYFHLNDFPYDVEDDIKHYLFWYNDEKYLNEFISKNKILTYWVNNKNNLSIKEIKHSHVFI